MAWPIPRRPPVTIAVGRSETPACFWPVKVVNSFSMRLIERPWVLAICRHDHDISGGQIPDLLLSVSQFAQNIPRIGAWSNRQMSERWRFAVVAHWVID